MRRNRVKAVINVPRGGRSAPTDRPLTPISSNSTHEPSSSPIPQHLQESSPMRSPSPLLSPTLKSPMDYPYPTLGLVQSPEKPCAPKILSVSPLPSVGSPSKADRFERPTTPLAHLDHFPYVNSTNFPISPGGIQRPSPSASPSRYIPIGGFPNSPQRPSPSPSPTNSVERNRQIVAFNTNSNSADSHEVAR
jgi:hypothetical protein